MIAYAKFNEILTVRHFKNGLNRHFMFPFLVQDLLINACTLFIDIAYVDTGLNDYFAG